MAEQLILKGTLEGHVSCPSRCQFERLDRFRVEIGIGSTLAAPMQLSIPIPAQELTRHYRMAGSPAWPRRWRSTSNRFSRFDVEDLRSPWKQPEHAPFGLPRQDPDHLEPHPR
jgi:hypothetical protein